MDWIQLKDEHTLNEIKNGSSLKPIVIFKHSTRCSISSATLARLERSWNKVEMEGIKFYFLDLIAYRPISQKVEEIFQVRHESPQMLLIHQGNCIFHNSHMGISYPQIKEELSKIAVKN